MPPQHTIRNLCMNLFLKVNSSKCPVRVVHRVSVHRDLVRQRDLHECAAIQRGEQRVQLPSEGSREGVDVRLCLCIVEGDLALFVVQVDAHTSGHDADRQRRLRLGAGIEVIGAAPQHPVALLRGHGEAAATFGLGGGHSNAPVAVVGYVDLPVVAAAAVALPAQHGGPGVESLAAVGLVGLWVALLDHTLVVWQLQPGVVGHRVEGHISWQDKEGQVSFLYCQHDFGFFSVNLKCRWNVEGWIYLLRCRSNSKLKTETQTLC